MAQAFPYTFYSCPCVDTSMPSSRVRDKRSSQYSMHTNEEEDRTFDPRNRRSNFSLYPLEHLLYCEDCHQIRCPRCVSEEVITWFCPSCLFEVPSSNVRSEGNRCMRSCFNCPVCTAPLAPFSLNSENEKHLRLGEDGETIQPPGPFYLACSYCQWSTLETGVEFEKPNNISGQLARLANGGKTVPTLREREKARDKRKEAEENGKKLDEDEDEGVQDDNLPLDHDMRFSNMSAFYKSQLQTDNMGGAYGDYSSSTLSRIMNMYSGSGSGSSSGVKKSKKDRPSAMREAAGTDEGFQVHNHSSEDEIIRRMREVGWDGTIGPEQRQNQTQGHVHFAADLRPVPTLLRTKRAKRCRTCRHILARPETKITSSRYKIKLLALSNIPQISLKALPRQTETAVPGITAPVPFDYNKLQPFMANHFILTIRNPLFDSIRVTLATPAFTPGRVQSKVTVLCPEFEVGANTDVWDEALTGPGATQKKSQAPSSTELGASNPATQAEAGKVWERGRNWTSVVLEVVPDKADPADLEGGLDEDEDVLEIPMFVRIEYETDVTDDIKEKDREKGKETGGADGKVKREEAFWCVLGGGRIGALPKLG